MIRNMFVAAVLLGSLPVSTSAATFEIDFNLSSPGSIIGTFEAPETGGVVTNFMATIMGVQFDTQISMGNFEYDPAQGDFVDNVAFPTFTNSVGAPLCGATDCLLQLYPTPGDMLPGDYLAIDAMMNNIDYGTLYEIYPDPVGVVPLPATAFLLIGALATTAAMRRRLS